MVAKFLNQIKYEGYIKRQLEEIEKYRRNEDTALPSDMVAISFIGEESQSTWRKPTTCRKSLTNLIT
jgi:tRNA U34 5-carboxymethylaminomethyl modifying enzyme MnmG/GidA